MKLELVKGIQKLFKNIAKNTIGKSFPPGMHERDVYKRQLQCSAQSAALLTMKTVRSSRQRRILRWSSA